MASHLTASDGTPLTGRLALRHALSKAVVAAADNRREVTLSWLEVAQDLAEEILWEEPLRESMQRSGRVDTGA